MTPDQTATTTQEQTVQQTSSPTQALDAPSDRGGETPRDLDAATDPDRSTQGGPDRGPRAVPEPGAPTRSPGTAEVGAAAEPARGGQPDETPLVARVTEQRLRRIGVWSTTAVAAVVGVLTALLVFLAGVGVWLLATESGLVARGEDLVSAVTTDGTFVLDSGSLLAGWAFLAGVWAVTLTALGFVLAVIVNTACALTGGIRLKLVSKPSRRPTRRRRPHLAAAPVPGAAPRPAEVAASPAPPEARPVRSGPADGDGDAPPAPDGEHPDAGEPGSPTKDPVTAQGASGERASRPGSDGSPGEHGEGEAEDPAEPREPVSASR